MYPTADRIDDFVQVEPDNMARPTERTIVQIAYDSRYLTAPGSHIFVAKLSYSFIP